MQFYGRRLAMLRKTAGAGSEPTRIMVRLL
jgi:hypothetical protein